MIRIAPLAKALVPFLFGTNWTGLPTTTAYQSQLDHRIALNLDPVVTHASTNDFHVQNTPLPISPIPVAPFPNGLCGGRLVTLDNKHLEFGLLLPPRPITIWVPPEYDTLNRSYHDHPFPVLYCHDGQNACEDSTSWTGCSWRLTGALTRLVERNLLETAYPPLVVMIPSAHEDLVPGLIRRRHLEYGDAGGLFAEAYLDLVAKQIKPAVDALFATIPGSAGSATIGSSLGGQTAFNLCTKYPQLFGACACLSPCFQPATIASIPGAASTLAHQTIYLDNGGDLTDDAEEEKHKRVPLFDPLDHMSGEHWWNPGYFWLDTQLQPGIDAVRMALDLFVGSGVIPRTLDLFDVTRTQKVTEEKGFQYGYEKFGGERHNERAWSKRIHRPAAGPRTLDLFDVTRTQKVTEEMGFQYGYEKFGGERHNERAWSKRIHRPLLHLYGKREVKEQLQAQAQLKP
eukprot:CAMPEP_0194395576 /NCGR_PEP_ID=MMETSP0174-20130528/124501_1 /TAXON_ID=216777 /ORGANISM="Proboscia alata, Strain PI-D3" /LENGTH=456 /DNA_ID=CAMNT_0039191529 /DNA_START=240 /DNA_END=1609 /DNA_ORIENTATION=-